MRRVIGCVLLLGTLSACARAEEAKCEKEACCSKAEHLNQAVAHLKAAGYGHDAARVLQRMLDENLFEQTAAKAAPAKTEVADKASSDRQYVKLELKIIEVSQTNLKQLGIALPDTALAVGDGIAPLVEALERENLAKVLDAPTLVAASGQEVAYFNGGEYAVPTKLPDGSVSVEHRPYGTEVTAKSTLLDDERVQVEFHPRITQISPFLGMQAAGVPVPGVRSFQLDSALEMKLGQTAVLRGRVQQRVERRMLVNPIHELTAFRAYLAMTAVVGGPALAQAQFFEPRFDHVTNHVQTLILVTPERVDAPEKIAAKPGETSAK